MYVTGLEALLLRQNETRGVTRKLSKRVSCLLASDDKKRQQLFLLMKQLYKLRCDIVHGETASTVQIEDALDYVRWFLYAVVKRLVTGPENFASIDEIAERIDRKAGSTRRYVID